MSKGDGEDEAGCGCIVIIGLFVLPPLIYVLRLWWGWWGV